jgi:hypothetical protein
VSKSKFDIVRMSLASMVFAGCDAMRVPEPGPSTTPLRPAIMAVVVPGRNTLVTISRPLTDMTEFRLDVDWFDRLESNISVVDPSSTDRGLSRVGFTESEGLRASAYLWDGPDSGAFGLRGVLKWNASTPFTPGAGNSVVDSFDLRPEDAERIEFQRNMVRAEIGMRWPRLAGARVDSLVVWSKLTDSVEAFLRDWESLCVARGASDGKILAYNLQANPPSYQWKLPDTAIVRRIMDGSEHAQTVFAAGDSIWTLNGRVWIIYLGITSEPANPVWGELTQVNDPMPEPFSKESFSGPSLWLNDLRNVVGFAESYGGFGQAATSPVRFRFQITGICPSVLDWRHYGATDRNHRPRGNVAPFDGYFCRILPDTISFPRGDVILVPPDTSTTPKTGIVVPQRDTTATVNFKVIP